MQEVRCPECGYRLKTNECPICCKRVPFPKAVKPKRVKTKKNWTRNVEVSFPKAGTSRRRAGNRNGKMKIVPLVIAVMAAVFSLVVELIDDMPFAAPEPERYEASYHSVYQAAGTPGAEHIPTLEPQLIYDDHGITISVHSFGLIYDNPAVRLTVSNTSEQNVTVSTENMAVNGFMMNSSGLHYEIGSGETADTYLRLYAHVLEEAGIDTVAEIELELHLYDSEEYTDIGSNTRIKLETSAAGLVQSVDDSGRVVYDDGAVRLILKDARVDEYGDRAVTFFAENLTDHGVYIGTDAVFLNGEESDAMLWCYLWPGMRSIDHFYIFDIAEEFGIDETGDLKELGLELYIENAENWEVIHQSTVTIAME